MRGELHILLSEVIYLASIRNSSEESAPSKQKSMSDEMLTERFKLIETTIFTCTDVLDLILSFLVEDELNESENSISPKDVINNNGVWISLPFEIILEMQKV